MVSTPSYPDPVETAAAQSDLNRQTATTQQLLNMVDQVTPYGTISYSQTGQTFVPDSTGDTWYVDPEGNYTQTAPGMVTTTTPGTTTATRDPGTHNIGFLGGSTTTPGTSTTSLPEGWTTATGYYVPRYTQTTTLSDEQQQILDGGSALADHVDVGDDGRPDRCSADSEQPQQMKAFGQHRAGNLGELAYVRWRVLEAAHVPIHAPGIFGVGHVNRFR